MRQPPPAGRAGRELQPLAQRVLGENIMKAKLNGDLFTPARTLPVTSACALMACQSRYSTGASMLVTGEIKAVAGIERNRPLAARSARTTPAISAARAARSGSSVRKSGMAMGTGSITPSVISMRSGPRSCASAGRARLSALVIARRKHRIIYRPRIRSGLNTISISCHWAYFSRGKG